MFATKYGQTNIVDKLLQNENLQINIKNFYGYTAIFYALRSEDPNIVDRLIANGSNVWVCNKFGLSLLHCAYNIDVLQRLLSLGLDINQQDDQGRTPLMHAVRYMKKKRQKFYWNMEPILQLKIIMVKQPWTLQKIKNGRPNRAGAIRFYAGTITLA